MSAKRLLGVTPAGALVALAGCAGCCALQRDALQIFTPTDVIGQHIHLVKFDDKLASGLRGIFRGTP